MALFGSVNAHDVDPTQIEQKLELIAQSARRRLLLSLDVNLLKRFPLGFGFTVTVCAWASGCVQIRTQLGNAC